MLTYIKGILTQSCTHHVTLETHGIGYKIHIPIHLYSGLPPLQSEMKLHTSFIIREYSQALYGFLSPNERDFFEQLLEVSGIGPKLALSLIGHLPLPDLAKAIAENNIAHLCKVPGIGKKTAERLIIELRNKIQHPTPYTSADLSLESSNDPRSQAINDAMSALINLGYNQMTAQKAIKKSMQDLSDTVTLAELITAALKSV
jgi:Holliday junction DNA helicase RuvA